MMKDFLLGGVIMKQVVNITKESISKNDLKFLIDLINSIKYGSVTIIIQDGKVIQIETNEKIRIKC